MRTRTHHTHSPHPISEVTGYLTLTHTCHIPSIHPPVMNHPPAMYVSTQIYVESRSQNRRIYSHARTHAHILLNIRSLLARRDVTGWWQCAPLPVRAQYDRGQVVEIMGIGVGDGRVGSDVWPCGRVGRGGRCWHRRRDEME